MHPTAPPLPGRAMHRSITGYHQDPDGEWVAELDCGHSQHVRHDPPWQVREWILSEETRREHLGTLLACRLCVGSAGDREE